MPLVCALCERESGNTQIHIYPTLFWVTLAPEFLICPLTAFAFSVSLHYFSALLPLPPPFFSSVFPRLSPIFLLRWGNTIDAFHHSIGFYCCCLLRREVFCLLGGVALSSPQGWLCSFPIQLALTEKPAALKLSKLIFPHVPDLSTQIFICYQAVPSPNGVRPFCASVSI